MNSGLRLAFLTPGTGGWFCGACMRDNALVNSLRAAGHEVSLLPMYLPLRLDEEPPGGFAETPVFFGGINVYLQQKHALFRHTPGWLDNLLDHPSLLRKVAGHGHLTSAHGHGAMTLGMLRFETAHLDKETDKLVTWIEVCRPTILCLSTALQAGMIRELKRRIGVKVICFFQGEDTFLDSLPEPFRSDCWAELSQRVRDADMLVSPSGFYAGLMRERLGLDAADITVIPNGINLEGYHASPAPPDPPVIGFLARLCRDKGLEVMVDAFIHLRKQLRHPNARMHLAGSLTAEHGKFVNSLERRLADAGLAPDVTWQTNLSRRQKAEMLAGLTLFSVPAIYQEAFGLYVVEAMAAGLPVVQPRAASFPEILGASGVLVPPADPVALARTWNDLLRQPTRLRELGATNRHAAERYYDVNLMRDRFVDLARRVVTNP